MATLLEERTRSNHDQSESTNGTDDALRQPDVRRHRFPVRLVATLAGLAVVVPLAGRIPDLLPTWGNPVEQHVVDRSTPPLLLALDDLSEYHAASGTFQVVLDRERDRQYVPSVISGERISFLATGTADAYVDFAGLGPNKVRTSADRLAVTISLPAPRVGKVRVDPARSRVLDRDRGIVERVGGMFAENPSAEREMYTLADRKLTRAAARSDLRQRAEQNTRAMLTTLAHSLGYERVVVTFEGTKAVPAR